ncbi:MAG TPA: hypothetical protein VIX80_05365 [Candidatus Kapabacteria bacterium]
MASKQYRKVDRKRLASLVVLLQLFVFTPMIISSFYGCAHTVEEQTIHDTDTVLQNDTTFKVPNGAAFIRFTSYINDAGPILLKTRISNSEFLFGSSLSQTVKDYIPVRNDTSFTLYAEYYNGPTKFIDSISIPADSLSSFSLTSIALFQVSEGSEYHLSPYFANDSMKNVFPANGFCYFRLTNSLPDHPQPTPSVNAYLDDPNGTPLFSLPATYQEIRNYVLIPAGQHTIILKSITDGNELYRVSKLFYSGVYYSGRMVGKKELSTDQFVIDME